MGVSGGALFIRVGHRGDEWGVDIGCGGPVHIDRYLLWLGSS